MNNFASVILERNRNIVENIALVDQNGQRALTWRELKTQVLCVAVSARRRGLTGLIPICMPRCAETVISILGLSLAGLGVAPLGANTPEQRCRLISEDTGNAIWRQGDYDKAMGETPEEFSAPDTLFEPAYVVYTSGSTGTPKGVMLSHEAILAAFARTKSPEFFDLTEKDAMAQISSFSFVALLMTLFAPLYAGSTVHIVPDEAVHDMTLMTDYLNAHQITAIAGPPKALKLLGDVPSLKVMGVGSDRVCQMAPKSYRLINIYGMSETGGPMTAYKIISPEDATPIGVPLGGFEYCILNEQGQPADEGELCISGPIADGYYNRPDLTAKAFTDNPFAYDEAHKILLHTGDLVRRLPDGNLLYINRKDLMFKINGQRIEPGEVENALRQLDGIRDAVVKGFTEQNGYAYLCGYYEAARELSPEVLQKALAARLPAYMIPSYFVRLDKIPVNTNGKVDRTALLPPEKAVNREYAAPANAEETVLCHAFETALNLPRVGAEDDFLSLGGDSIRTMEVVRLAASLQLSAVAVLEGRTPRGIASLLGNRKNSVYENLSPAPAAVRLTDSQMSVYLQCMLQPESVMYNIPFRMSLRRQSGMTVASVKQAVDGVLSLHSALYAHLKSEEDQILLCKTEFPKEGICTAEEPANLAQAEDGFVRSFDLFAGPLCRASALLTEDTLVILLDCHHIVCDGTSISLLAKQICDRLAGLPLQEETVDAFCLAEAEQRLLARDGDTAKDYFDRLLSDVETNSNLLFDTQPENPADGHTARITHALTLPGLNDYLKDNALTHSSFFMGVFGYALAKMTGQGESLFAVAENGRASSLLDSTVSMLVRTLPVFLSIDETKPAAGLLKGCQAQLYRSIQNDARSFAELSRQYGINADVMFVYQSDMLSGFESPLGSVELSPIEINEGFTNLSFVVLRSEETYNLTLNYRSCCYTPRTIERFFTVFEQAARSFVSGMLLKDIPLTDAQDLAFLNELNRTESPFDASKTVVDLFRSAAKQFPDNTAVVCKNRRYTYREADAISDRIAAYLHTQGIERGQVVSILIPRCEYMALASIGVLKAGAVYQPLDPAYPADRLAFMCKDADSRLLIADRDLLSVLPDYNAPILCLDEIADLPEVPVDFRLTLPCPDDGFVLLYTSGTTGLPKGCKLLHRNIATFTHAYFNIFPYDSTCAVGAYASFGFDAHICDIFPILTVGGSVHIITEDIRLDLPAIKDYLETNAVCHLMMTTQLGRQFAMEYPEVKYLRSILVGGEKLASFTPPRNYRIVNGYGPTETTLMVSYFTVDKEYADIPIGKALCNTKLYVADRYGRRVPVGVPGELVVCGPQVSFGYINREEKTKEVFVPNIYEAGQEGFYSHCYLTGDVARFMESGNLEIIGRRDQQVKIRGFRIELSEVEAVIREYPGISDATVIAVDDPSGGKCIHAYVVSDQTVDISKLNQFIRERKPQYMVPAATMQLEGLPLTPNLKVDKRKLPPIVQKEATAGQSGCRSLTMLEQKISDLLKEIVGHDGFDVDTDLSLAGLSSISSIRFAVQIYKQFGIHITSKELLDNCTILDLEDKIVTALLSGQAAEQAAESKQLQKKYPLTQTQVGIYTECLAGSMDTYNIPLLLKLAPETDLGKLKDAVIQAVKAHPSMLCYIDTDETGEPSVYPTPNEDITVEEASISDLPPAATHFAFGKSPLYRFRLLHFGAETYFFAELHHIIADGESFRILMEDIDRAYAGQAPEGETYSAFDLALEEAKARKGAAFTEAKDYYDSVFRGISADYVPVADCRGASAFGEATYPVASAREEIAAFCKQTNISENVFFNGAFALTIAQFTSHEDALYATIHNGRTDPRTERLISMLVKTLPVYTDAAPATAVPDFLRHLDERIKKLKQYDLYSFADAAKGYGVGADVMFIYQGDLMGDVGLPGSTSVKAENKDAASKAPICGELLYSDGAYKFHLEYDAGKYSPTWMETFADAYATCVRELLCKSTLGEVDICSEKSLARFTDFNDTAWDVPYRPAYRVIEERAEQHPDRTAVIAHNGRLTYRQLDQMANFLARQLVSLQIPSHSTVEIILDRRKEIYVAQLGVLKSANVFLCLAPDWPDERVSFISLDASAKAIITTHTIAAEKQALLQELGLPVLYADDLDESVSAEPLNLEIEPEALAYLIYTSGSTGKPKGVTATQLGLVNLAHPNPKNSETIDWANGHRISTAVTAFTFDASLFEGFIPLANGSTVCIAGDEEIHNPDSLCRLILKNGVTGLWGTPSFVLNLLDYSGIGQVLNQLEVVLMGGEDVTPVLVDRLFAANPRLCILNGYGPSEATITCSCKSLKPGDPITIGTPLANTEIYCLDTQGHILPMGALGELTIIGDGVGKGYLNRDDLTKRAFITIHGKPAFRTGDLALITHEGEIQFHGRIDNQVKIRGLRVELGEIESAINSFPGVKGSVAVAKGTADGKYLAAYYTAERDIPSTEIIEHISKTLTPYMVPRVFMQLESFPMTANGKVDKKALPEVTAETRQRAKTPPKNATEQMLCDLFAEVLKLDRVYAEDNFFEIGGSSLSASRVVMQLKAKGYRAEYQDIFDCQTPRDLAAYLTQDGDEADTSAENTSAGGDPTDAQYREALSHNTLQYADRVRRESLGNVLLTGATGFLGIHVLYELLHREEGHIYCLVRKSSFSSPESRLDAMCFYYFDECLQERFPGRITLLDADITSDNLFEVCRDIPFDTLINCAACVKHFASDNRIEFVNVHGVDNLIVLAKEKNARLVHISTTSIAGVHTETTLRRALKLTENSLFAIDDMANQYCISKYRAEQHILQAVSQGLRAKILRVGNLMGRHRDGEFQINMGSNAFLNALKGFVAMGMCPVSHGTDPMEFSPIDCTAQAIVALAGTNDMFTVFHANSRFVFDEHYLIEACNRCGLKVVPTDDRVYYETYNRLLGDERINKSLAALVTNDRPDLHAVDADNRFTANVLYRLGFRWPFVDNTYLDKVIESLKSIGFFGSAEQ